MIINKTSDSSKMTDRSVVSVCSLSALVLGTGLSGGNAVRPASLPVAAELVRDERPLKALEAVEAKAGAYAFTAAGAGKQTTQHHQMWAFRGPDPWSDPA